MLRLKPLAVLLLTALAATAASAPALDPSDALETQNLHLTEAYPRQLFRKWPTTSTQLLHVARFSARRTNRQSDKTPSPTPVANSPQSSPADANGTPLPTPSPIWPGLTMDLCTTSSDCVGNRQCKTGFIDKPRPCGGQDDCLCLPPKRRRCTDSDECVNGEVCARYGVSDVFCASEVAVSLFSTLVEIGKEEVEPSPLEPSEDRPNPVGQASVVQDLPSNVCIEVGALQNIKKEELVFAEHLLARVLCDSYGSCATPGHIVLVHGKAMMMKSYCASRSCERRVMHVNGPRYRRGMVIESNTGGLAFTAFAARYETKSEEAIIAVAIRLGL